MADFPTSLDSLTNPSPTDKLNNPSHSTQHQLANDAIEAIEAKVGVNSSAVTTTHDYKLSGVTGTTKAVAGPASATNKALAAFNGTSGNIIQNTPATIDTTDGSITMSAGTATLTVGDLVTAPRVHTDTITEKTGNAGVTIETVLLKDGIITGTPGPGTVIASSLSTELQKGWENYYGSTQFPAPSTVTYNGNRSYDLVFNSVDLTGAVSTGQRLKLTRSVTAPTQCTDLESGSSQYYSKTTPNKLTFTDDYTDGAWVKLESYVAGGIIARRNADTEGWSLSVNASGQLVQGSYRIAANNSVTTSYQSLPLNKWVHVAASTDLSGTSVLLYIDGVLAPSLTTITGTITALVQGTTALVVGAEKSAGTNPFDGKIAQAFVATGVISAANIRTLISQGLTSALISTFSIQSAYSFDNSIADLNTTTPNDLTAQGSAVATATDSPFGIQADGTTAGTTEYGIVTKTAFSTNTTLTVQVPEGNAIPTSGGVSAVSYSTQKAPYGLPISRIKWRVEANYAADLSQANPVAGTYYNMGASFTFPIGEWEEGYQAPLIVLNGTNSPIGVMSLSTSASALTDNRFTGRTANGVATASNNTLAVIARSNPVTETSATLKYLIVSSITASSTSIAIRGSTDTSTAVIYADLAYL